MSNENPSNLSLGNITIRSAQDLEVISKQISQMKNLDKKTVDAFLEKLTQMPANKQQKQVEFQTAPSTKKRTQPKSKIIIKSETQFGPISPYAVFLKHMHNMLIEADKNLSFSQRSVIIANIWAMMSEKDKDPFKYSANMANENFK